MGSTCILSESRQTNLDESLILPNNDAQLTQWQHACFDQQRRGLSLPSSDGIVAPSWACCGVRCNLPVQPEHNV